MTIRDLMEQGIEIQGAYKIQTWDDEASNFPKLLEEGEDFRYNTHNEKLLDMEIKYIYATQKNGTIDAYTVFEVGEED